MLYLTLVLSTKHNIFGDFFFRINETRKSSKRFQNSTQKGDKGHKPGAKQQQQRLILNNDICYC